MAENKQTALFELISSLDGPEKRYIRIATESKGGNKQYLQLFEAISRQRINDEKKLAAQLGMGKVAYNNTRNYLYSFILKCLTQYHAASGAKANIQGFLQQVDVLFDKALYGQCLKILKRARKLAEKYHAKHLIQEILIWELRIMLSPSYRNELKKDVQDIFREEQELLQELKTISTFRSMRFAMLKKGEAGRRRDLSPSENNIILQQGLTNKPTVDIEVLRTRYHYWITKNYAKNARDNILKEVQILEEYPELIEERVMLSKYVNALGMAASACLELKQFDECESILNKLQQAGKKLIGSSPSRHIHYRTFCNYHQSHLELLLAAGRSREAMDFVNRIEDHEFYREGKMNLRFLIPLQFTMALVNYRNKELSGALKLLRSIDQRPKKEIEDAYRVHVVLMQMVIHWEKGEVDLVESLLGSLDRSVNELGITYMMEKQFVRMFRQLLNARETKERHVAIRQFEMLITENQSQLKQQRRALPFDCALWLKAQLPRW